MDVVGIEIVRERRRRATVPTCYSTACTVHGAAGCEGKRAAARVGDAGRGASPTAGKREGISF